MHFCSASADSQYTAYTLPPVLLFLSETGLVQPVSMLVRYKDYSFFSTIILYHFHLNVLNISSFLKIITAPKCIPLFLNVPLFVSIIEGVLLALC